MVERVIPCCRLNYFDTRHFCHLRFENVEMMNLFDRLGNSNLIAIDHPLMHLLIVG